jgi:UDP-glucose 4-epimerase
MKILVTGGAGFIGSHIVDAYLGLGHEVHIIDDFSTGKEENLNPAAQVHRHDIADRDAVTALLARERFEVINHHAAQMDVRRSVADPQFDARVNIMGSINLLEAGVQNGLRKLIFASSGGTVYGEQEYFPADESHPLRPISPYGIAKATVEKYMYFYQLQYGLNTVALRYANIYGPRQNPHGEAGVVAIFAQKMLAGSTPTINGDGGQTRDYVMVEDVVQANVLALSHEGGGNFNIGMGVETDVVRIFDVVNDYCGGKHSRTFGPAKPGEQRRSVLSGALISRTMGWKPRHDFESGMKVTLDWFAAQRSKSNVHG